MTGVVKDGVVKDGRAMVAGMTPVLAEGDFVFATTADPALAASAAAKALGSFREAEGLSLILPLAEARKLGFDCAMPMRQITLNVYSALDGTGLTAAVAGALAEDGIPCNMVAAFHHDHVFVPAEMAERAMVLLKELQRQAAAL
jgi:hypothetical protein